MDFSAYPVYLSSIGLANPPTRMSQSLALSILEKLYGAKLKPRSMNLLSQLFAHPSIANRFIAVDDKDALEFVPEENPDDRILRFKTWAVKLSVEAAVQALDRAGLKVPEVGALVVNTCTGYLCPGIATYVSEELGLSPDTPVYDLAGSGCGGAVPNLELGAALLTQGKKKAVLCISVEICSATFQMGEDIGLILSNALFGDGAAAVLLTSDPGRFRFMRSGTLFLPAYREMVRFVYKNGSLQNQLSPKLPSIVVANVPQLVTRLLSESGMVLDDLRYFAIHPGGEKILDGLQQAFEIPDGKMAVSRFVLKEFGNMSSPTVLFELEQIIRANPVQGERALVLAFGAGMAAHGLLLLAV